MDFGGAALVVARLVPVPVVTSWTRLETTVTVFDGKADGPAFKITLSVVKAVGAVSRLKSWNRLEITTSVFDRKADGPVFKVILLVVQTAGAVSRLNFSDRYS